MNSLMASQGVASSLVSWLASRVSRAVVQWLGREPGSAPGLGRQRGRVTGHTGPPPGLCNDCLVTKCLMSDHLTLTNPPLVAVK